jgi:bifunctional polynucleotide phosphatase/kinase
MTKEKLKQSSLTSYFQPYNTKKERTPGSVRWAIHGSLLKGVYTPKTPLDEGDADKGRNVSERQVGIAAFDLDQTITHTKSGMPWPNSGSDWRWVNSHVQRVLRNIGRGNWVGYDRIKGENWRVVIVTNQGGFVYGSGKRSEWFVERVESVSRLLDIPLRVYAATKPKKGFDDIYRKPSTEIWAEIVRDLQAEDLDIDISRSFFVGDAAGRPTDHSDADIEFARGVGLLHILPEDFFVADNEALSDSTKVDSAESVNYESASAIGAQVS